MNPTTEHERRNHARRIHDETRRRRRREGNIYHGVFMVLYIIVGLLACWWMGVALWALAGGAP